MMEDYTMSLSFNNRKEAFFFPVLPEKVELLRAGKGKTYDIVKLGEINKIHPRELAGIRFESFFPKQAYHFADKRLLPVETYLALIDKWWKSEKPMRFIYSGSPMAINMAVSIENFDIWEQAGEAGDVYFSIELKEYVFHTAKKVKVVTSKSKKKTTATASKSLKADSKARPDMRVRPTTYTIKKGDTLSKIAKQQLGDSSRWKELMTLNGLTNAQLKTLKVGAVIKLPKD